MQVIINVFWLDGEASKSQCSPFLGMAVPGDRPRETKLLSYSNEHPLTIQAGPEPLHTMV